MKYLNSVLDLLFPKKCINCGRRGSFLCDDCLSLIEINPFQFCFCETPQKIIIPKCSYCPDTSLDEIYSACDANNFIFKKITKSIKEKYLIDLCFPLSLLILTHLQIIGKKIHKDYLVMSVPIGVKEKKRKGFSESEEITKIISKACSLKISNESNVKDKNILLIDLLYTNEGEINKYAKLLKEKGAKKVIGLVVARG